MALVLPVLVMFTFGMLELGIFVACYVNGTYAAHAAVRYAIVHGSASTNPCTALTLQSQVKPFLVGIPSSAITIAPTWGPNTDAGSTVTVKITYSYPITIPFYKARTLTAVASASGVIVE
jgi:Flp pilus assembly protein TadG